jgi:signal transduction histidine kinase
MQNEISTKKDMIRNIYNKKLEEWERDYILRLKFITQTPRIKDSIISGDMQTLKDELILRYKSMRGGNKYVNTFHYIDKNNISKIRAHMPKVNGDDLSSARPIVVKANYTQKVQTGIEAGKYAFSYRITSPIIYDGIHYGVLEIGFDMRFYTEMVEGVIENIKSALLIKESEANRKYLKDLKSYDGFYLYQNEYGLNSKFFDSVKSNTLDIDNRKYIKTELYLDDFTDQNIVGKVLYFKEYTKQHNSFIADVFFLTTISVLFIIFTVSMIYYGLLFYEKELKKETNIKEQKEELLRKQNRLAIMGEMIAMIAHQWRQPLAAIMASAQAVKLKKRLGKLTGEFEDEKLDEISSLTKHLSTTIDDFKNFFRQDKKITKCNPYHLIKKTIEFLDYRIRMSNIKIEINDNYKLTVDTYCSELMQVSMNLITNAIDELVDKDGDRIIEVNIESDREYLYITISDNAGGVPIAIIDRIFEPYFSTKSENGTGLGLYMSKVIIDQHLKGLLSVSNSITGADFVIKIPLVLEP